MMGGQLVGRGGNLVDGTEGEVGSSNLPHLRRLEPQLWRLSGDDVRLGTGKPSGQESLGRLRY